MLYPLALVFPFTMTVAASLDVLTLSIPNRVVIANMLGFLVASISIGLPIQQAVAHVGAGALMVIVGFAMFSGKWIGGGDAKLMAAAALWLGFDHLLSFLFWTVILGGGLSLFLLAYRRILPPLWLVRQAWAMRLHDPKEGIPYGVAIAGAGLIVYPQTIWMTGIAG